MKEVVLATAANDVWRHALEGGGFSVVDIRPGAVSEDVFPHVGSGTPVIIETEEDPGAQISSLVGAMNRDRAWIIIACDRISDRIRAFAFKEGITDVLLRPSAQSLPAYLKALAVAPTGNGRFLLMDDMGPVSLQMESLVTRFGYSMELVSTEDAFFESTDKPGVVWTVCNLGAKGFDVGRFVRRCAVSFKTKGIPCIPFKDERDGYFVHEFVSGLNRIARVVMSPGELLGFIVSLLFRVELARLSAKLDAETFFTERSEFQNEPFPRIYHSLGMNIFSMENICDDTRQDRILDTVGELKNFLLRCRGLNWLVESPERLPTCGSGV